MSQSKSTSRRTERATFETDTHLIVGDITMPPAGYQSRFSDLLNRQDIRFISLINVEITALADGCTTELPFIVLNKGQIRHAYPMHQ